MATGTTTKSMVAQAADPAAEAAAAFPNVGTIDAILLAKTMPPAELGEFEAKGKAAHDQAMATAAAMKANIDDPTSAWKDVPAAPAPAGPVTQSGSL